MSARDHDALDALVARARAAQPPALTPLESRRCVRLAVAGAERARAQKRRLLWLCAACLALGLTMLVTNQLTMRGTAIEVAAGGRPLRVALTSGDSLLAAPGTQLEVIAQEPARRTLRLRTGSALFDVLRLDGTQRFEVFTGDARVVVRGTVFSVEVSAGRTIVRVYEGRVFVAERSVGAGEVWVSSGPAAALADDPLHAEGRAAAGQRLPAPSLIVSSLPDVTASAQAGASDAGIDQATVIVVSTPPPLPVAAQPASALPAETTLEEARQWLLTGDSERALAAAQAAGSVEPAWQLLEADALRALRRYAEAVDRYQGLAERAPALRVSAGYTGASLALYELHDPSRALALLDVLSLDDASSQLRERASVLRVDVLLALGKKEDAKLSAQRYLEREPETQVSRRMRALAR